MDKKFERNVNINVFGRHLFSLSSLRIWQKATPKKKSALSLVPPADAGFEDKGSEPLLVINSLMLHDCFKLLTRTENESLHAVTGSIIGNIRSLERIIPLSLSEQNVVGAAADNGDLADRLMRLNDFGLRPLAYFHSHPSCGVNATCPSSTDRQTQSTMEMSGSKIIGGIFSRDGYIRFYANKSEPNMRVMGKRVRKVEKNVYQLEIEEDL
jgi:proteasome lid subunit RPN8/RPN11